MAKQNPLKNLSKFLSPIFPGERNATSKSKETSPINSTSNELTSTRMSSGPTSSSKRGPSLGSSSPFPFGTPITFSQRSTLNPRERNAATEVEASPSSSPKELSSMSKSKSKGKDFYGGRVMFGGSNYSNGTSGTNLVHNIRRHNRLLASAPYQTSLGQRAQRNQAPTAKSPSLSRATASSTGSTTPSPASTPENLGMSSTARIILETLDKMSTPLRDAQKMPVPRAQKRQALAEELLERGSIFNEGSKRKRPKLGGAKSSTTGSSYLNGPPLRSTLLSPMPVRQIQTQVNRSSNFSNQTNHVTPKTNKSAPNVSRSDDTPIQSGKVRAKVSERAKQRVENALTVENEVPSYLSQAKTNPFASMNDMPTFKIGNEDITTFKSTTPEKSVASTSTKSLPRVEKKPSLKFSSPVEVLNKVFNTNEDNCEKVASLESPQSIVKSSFIFSSPKSISTLTNADNASSDHVFIFNNATPLKQLSAPNHLSSSNVNQVPADKATTFKFSSPQLPDLTDVGQNSAMFSTKNFNFQNAGLIPRKSSAELKSGNILGGNHKLPDVTAPAGLAPAKSLKQGSVMDILGKNSGSDIWKSSKSSISKTPWAT